MCGVRVCVCVCSSFLVYQVFLYLTFRFERASSRVHMSGLGKRFLYDKSHRTYLKFFFHILYVYTSLFPFLSFRIKDKNKCVYSSIKMCQVSKFKIGLTRYIYIE